MFRKLIVVSAAAVLCLAAVGCGGGKTKAAPSQSQDQAPSQSEAAAPSEDEAPDSDISADDVPSEESSGD